MRSAYSDIASTAGLSFRLKNSQIRKRTSSKQLATSVFLDNDFRIGSKRSRSLMQHFVLSAHLLWATQFNRTDQALTFKRSPIALGDFNDKSTHYGWPTEGHPLTIRHPGLVRVSQRNN